MCLSFDLISLCSCVACSVFFSSCVRALGIGSLLLLQARKQRITYKKTKAAAATPPAPVPAPTPAVRRRLALSVSERGSKY